MNGLENNFGFWVAAISIVVAIYSFALLIIIQRRIFRDKIIARERLQKLFLVNDSTKKINKKTKMKYSGSSELIKKTKLFDVMKDELVLAGIMMKPDEVIIIWVVMIFVPACLVALFGGGTVISLLLVLIGLLAPPFYIRRSKAKHIEKFESQLSDALDIVSNCLRSGLTFHQALESIANEMTDPISREFKRVLREVQYGSTIDVALNGMTERIRSSDLTLMVSAVLIQRQVGGNLSELLNNISFTIKERIKLKQEIKVLTSTGRMSGMVIAVLPLVIMVLLMVINPGYISVFFETSMGRFMLLAAAGMEVLGFFIVNKIVTIKY